MKKWRNFVAKTFSLILFLVTIPLTIYYFIYRHDPVIDAKGVLKDRCDCMEKRNEEVIQINKFFLDTFSSFSFHNRQEVKLKMMMPLDQAATRYFMCNQKLYRKVILLKNKYISNEVALKKFENTIQSSNNFTPKNSHKLILSEREVQKKLIEIKETDMENNSLDRNIQSVNL